VPTQANDAPTSAPATLPSASPKLASPPERAPSAVRAPASGVWARVARRACAPRDARSLAAGGALAAVTLGLAVLNALSPPRAPAFEAHIGLASGAVLAAARVVRTAPPTLSRLVGTVVPGPESAGTQAPPRPVTRAASAPSSRPAPAAPRERGQYRLRRGRFEDGAARGAHRPGS
jgi:hypothetical protein